MSERRREELEPEPGRHLPEEAEVPPEAPEQRRVDAGDVQEEIDALIERVTEGEGSSFDKRLVREILTAALKLIPDGRETGELKLMNAAVKELRYAFRVFGEYEDPRKVTIFGSARTPESHPDYAAAVRFSRLLAEAGWMSITGAGDGIMKAGHEGPGRDASFGVAIRLPFETTANTIIAGDEKLIHFRYFFTRKLMFLFHADAVALFPGGFGTMDEAFETLTLVQTGKASMIPIVMLEGQAGYWEAFDHFARTVLLERGLISAEDLNLYHISHTPDDAVEHILRFYNRYHSSRYVRDTFVIRLHVPLPPDRVAALNDEFGVLVKSGKIEQRLGPLDEEDGAFEHLHRLTFNHTRYKYGLVRQLIDRVNED